MANITIDHEKIINRIIDILKNNSNLYDVAKPSHDKLRKIQFVAPTYDMEDDGVPFGYIQVADVFEKTVEQVGTVQPIAGQRIAAYNIVVVDMRKDAPSVQSKLLGFMELIRATLVENPTLKHPTNNNDPLITRLLIGEASQKSSQKNAEKQGMMLTIQVILGKAYTVTLNGSLVIDLLSKPLDRTSIQADIDITSDGDDVPSGISDDNSLALEMENTAANKAAIKALIQAENEITCVLDGATFSETNTVFLLEYKITAPFGNIDRAVLLARVLA